MGVLKPGEELIANENDYTSGAIGWFGAGVNDAYDLYLVKDATGNFTLVIFMKIQFLFKDSAGFSWSRFEKNIFADQFKAAINKKWGNKRVLKPLSAGKQVYIDFRFEAVMDGWSVTEHWEITVRKIKKGGFSQSFVNPAMGTASLDSEDVNFVNKGFGMQQRGVVHEFGHMLGLPDEYEVGTPHASDYPSVMNRGESVSGRHDAVYIKWLEGILNKKGIK